MRKILNFTLGIFLYVNYRAAYVLLVHRNVHSLQRFASQTNEERAPQLFWVVLFDLMLATILALGLFYAVLAFVGVALLNLIYFLTRKYVFKR